MSKKKHHHEQEQHHASRSPKRKAHQDWRVLVAIGLAVLSMIVYVLSFDEEIQPDGAGPQQEVPAATLDGE